MLKSEEATRQFNNTHPFGNNCQGLRCGGRGHTEGKAVGRGPHVSLTNAENFADLHYDLRAGGSIKICRQSKIDLIADAPMQYLHRDNVAPDPSTSSSKLDTNGRGCETPDRCATMFWMG